MAPCYPPSLHRTLGLHAPQPEPDHVGHRKCAGLRSFYGNTPSPSSSPHHLTRDELQTVACRAVRRLATFQSRGAEMYSCVHSPVTKTAHPIINIAPDTKVALTRHHGCHALRGHQEHRHSADHFGRHPIAGCARAGTASSTPSVFQW